MRRGNLQARRAVACGRRRALARGRGRHPPPAVTRECKADTDCKATSQHLEGDDICCFACGRKPVNAGSLEAFDAWCDARTEKSSCPKYKCDQPEPAPVQCIEGTCQFNPAE